MGDPDLPRLTKRIKAISDPDEASRVYVWLSRLKAEALARLLSLAGGSKPAMAAAGDWITPAQAARISSLSVRWFYDHAHELPFVRKAGRRLLISEEGLRHWLERR